MMAEMLKKGGDPPTVVSNINVSIKRQRLVRAEENVPPPPQRSVARVLFGIPDPVKTRELFRKMCETREAEFREKWNFDPVEGLPCLVHVQESCPTTSSRIAMGKEERVEAKVDYVWNPVVSYLQPGSGLLKATGPLLSDTTENSAAANPITSFVSKEMSIPCKKRLHAGTASTLKQKSIKDYMKVKKVLREPKIVQEKKPVP